MLTKCSNPSCSARFRSLQDGRLFYLESDPVLRPDNSNRVEYFWLCGRCSSATTLRLGEDGTVVTVSLPKPIRSVPDGVALISVDRNRGLMLRSISSPLPKHLRDRMRTQLTDEHHVA